MKGIVLRPWFGLLIAAALCGCTTTTSSNTARTGKEQLLISNSVDQSLQKMDFSAFQGHTVFLNEKFLDCVDKGYIVGSLRHRMMRQGVHLAGKAEDADVIVEIRSGGVGTDTSDSYLGVPEVVLPGLITLPEVRLVTRSSQQGTVKLGLIAYDAKTMQVLGDGGVSLAQSDDNNWYFMGIGPYQSGSLRSELGGDTSLLPGQYYSDLPRQVVFAAPTNAGDPDAIRLTSEEAPAALSNE